MAGSEGTELLFSPSFPSLIPLLHFHLSSMLSDDLSQISMSSTSLFSSSLSFTHPFSSLSFPGPTFLLSLLYSIDFFASFTPILQSNFKCNPFSELYTLFTRLNGSNAMRFQPTKSIRFMFPTKFTPFWETIPTSRSSPIAVNRPSP